ncbi:green-sensitive opsin [Biomphalaria glabrata]|nr:green-sensitive opsin [Biomphalaria glabrata]
METFTVPMNVSSFNETKTSSSEKNFIDATIYYMVLFLMAVGLPGNVAAVVVMLKMKVRTPAVLAVAYMALFDSLALISKSISYGLEYEKVDFGVVGCKLYYVPVVACSSIANWTLVLICAERFISVTYPWKRSQIIKFRYLHKTVIAISVVLSIYFTIHFCVFFEWVDGKCRIVNSYLAYRFIRQAVSTLSPLILIIICTVSVMRKVSFSKVNRNITMQTKLSRRKLEAFMSRIMITTAILFFVLNIPYIVCVSILWPALDFTRRLDVVILINISYFLRDSSHALNFYIYVISAKGFRKQFFLIIKEFLFKEKKKREASIALGARLNECYILKRASKL